MRFLYLLDRRYLTGYSKHLGGGTGRVIFVHGGRKSQHSPSGQHVCPCSNDFSWSVGKMQLRNLTRLLGSLYRNLDTFCINRNISASSHYNCCSHRYDHQSQLELRSYRTEGFVVIYISNGRNILLFVANSLLCCKGHETRYFNQILNRGN